MMPPAKPRCGTCRYWSELMAKANGTGKLRALCLSRPSYQAGTYTTERSSCGAYSRGAPIDAHASKKDAA